MWRTHNYSRHSSMMSSSMTERSKLVLAYHDRSDGDLFMTVAEMAFAGRIGVEINLGMLDCRDSLIASSLLPPFFFFLSGLITYVATTRRKPGSQCVA